MALAQKTETIGALDTVENGQLAGAPLPRRYAQIEVQFAGRLFDTRRMRQLAFEYLVPPVADGLWAEVYPRQPKPSVRPAFATACG